MPYIWQEWSLMNTSLTRSYLTEPQENVCQGSSDKRCLLQVGRILGGTSSINAMFYVRGNKLDFDEWETMGAKNWSYDALLPYFIRSEDNHELGPDKYHGRGGPIGVTFKQWEPLNDLTSRWLGAATELGLNIGDYNGKHQAVFSPSQRTIRKGLRQSTDRTYIQPIEGIRKNLHILLMSHVTRVLFDGTQAVGIEYEHVSAPGKKYKVMASKEIILSAGALSSPQILLLSGVGPKKQLKKLGIDLVADLPVGENLMDHVRCVVNFATNATYPPGGEVSEANFKLWNSSGKGILGSMDDVGIGFIYTKKSKSKDDVQGQLALEFMPAATASAPKDILYRLSVLTWGSKPKSRGSLTLASTDPFEAPIIDPQYLTEEDDKENIYETIVAALRLSQTGPFQELAMEPMVPDLAACKKTTPWEMDYIKCYAKYNCFSDYHYSGTNKMGAASDPTAVVDERLRVIGIEGLRVADGSIMPSIIRGNTNAICMAIGEKAADLIRDDNAEGVASKKKKAPPPKPTDNSVDYAHHWG
ncbi:Glucose dehydrogenase -like protein [Halotydeus destructor]|nr:Glucose dehydrogenase -like protein [Halotydeus destructor]